MLDVLKIINDEKRLKKELIFGSLFVMTYENFVSSWKDTILWFFANSNEIIDGEVVACFSKMIFDSNGLEIECVPDKKAESAYRKRIYQRIKKADGNFDTELSLFDFMREFGLIDVNDYNSLIEIRKTRNLYSHEMIKVLFEIPIINARELFEDLIKIRKKANEFWIREVEIPTSSDDSLLDEDGYYQEPEWVASAQDLFFDVIISNVMKENEEKLISVN